MLQVVMLVGSAFGVDPPDASPQTDQIVAFVRQLPVVSTVDVTPARRPPVSRIIHVLDWHLVPRRLFAIELQNSARTKLSADRIDQRFDEHRRIVRAVQQEQLSLLQQLIERIPDAQVCHEGFTEDELPAYRRRIKVLGDCQRHPPSGNTPVEQFIRHQLETDLLQVGAPGQLLIARQIERVVPIEDRDAYRAARPVGEHGNIVIDPVANETREDAMVQHILAGGSIPIVVLGGAHDLTDNIPEDCEYVRIATATYTRQLAEIALAE